MGLIRSVLIMYVDLSGPCCYFVRLLVFATFSVRVRLASSVWVCPFLGSNTYDQRLCGRGRVRPLAGAYMLGCCVHIFIHLRLEATEGGEGGGGLL